MSGDEKSLKVDSPIWDNQVIGNSYLRTSENRKTRYGESHIGKSVTINNPYYDVGVKSTPTSDFSSLATE